MKSRRKFETGVAVLLEGGGAGVALETIVRTVRRDVPEVRVIVLRGDEGEAVEDVYVCCPVGMLERRAGARRGAPAAERRAAAAARLTPRECHVLARVAAGHTNKQIAAELGISLRTVETHRGNLTRKLGVSSVAGLTRYAIEHALTEDLE